MSSISKSIAKDNFLIRLLRVNGKYFPFFQWGTTAALVWALFQGFDPMWWLATLLMYFLIVSPGIVVTFHRYLAHHSFEMPKWMEYLFSWFGALAGTGGALAWVGVHRKHHDNTDTDKDPHGPDLGWKFFVSNYRDPKFNKWQMRDLLKSKYHIFVHNYYYGLLAAWGIGAFMIHPLLALFGVVIPMAIMIWVSNLTSYSTHKFGYRNHDTPDNSTNLWPIAILAFGEGWHNNHHANPDSWNSQEKWWELDPSAWVIWAIKRKKAPQKI